MAKIAWNTKELSGQGHYKQTGTWYGYPYNPVEKLSQPLAPEENLLKYYSDEEYEWIPDICSDLIDITPECIPDVPACGFAGGLDAFEVKWIPVENNEMLPAFVEPGFKLLDDVADWRSLKWPDADKWEWKKYADEFNEVHKGDDRFRRGVILTGYFERLIALMTFEEAAIALLTDPEECLAFFEALTDLNIKIIDHYSKDFGCKGILLHDDWAAQRAPFFSLDTCMKLLVPPLKRLVDYAHSKNIVFTFHSCGNGEALIPAMKAAGIDGWQAQDTALDLERVPELAKSAGFLFETYNELPLDLSGDKLKAHMEKLVDKVCSDRKGFMEFMDYDMERLPLTRKCMYEIGRKLALEGK